MMTEQERFESAMRKKFGNFLVDFRTCINNDANYMAWDTHVAWFAWQAATAQAVSEGYVFVPVDALREVLSTAGDALMDESTSSVFDKDGTVSTWYDRYHISEQQLISALEATKENDE